MFLSVSVSPIRIFLSESMSIVIQYCFAKLAASYVHVFLFLTIIVHSLFLIMW